MTLIEKILGFFKTKENTTVVIVPFERNETCFCGSGIKYKKCHALKLEPKSKTAYRLTDKKTGKVKIKILKTNSLKSQSNLRWVDIGVGSSDKVN